MFVLGLARTGLIFTRIQEGAQLGGQTPAGQTEQVISYHVPVVLGSGGGELGSGKYCPYPDPPVSACFFTFSSTPRRGVGVAAWRFCYPPQPNHNNVFVMIMCFFKNKRPFFDFYESKLRPTFHIAENCRSLHLQTFL